MTVSKDDIAAIQAVGAALSPVATQLSAAVRQLERSLGPVLDRLNEWSAAGPGSIDTTEESEERS